MAPTTMQGQTTTTSPYGRDFAREGYPIRMAELMSMVEGTTYCSRVAVNTHKNLMQAKKALKKAFEVQINNLGFSFVEFLSSCPTNWKMSSEKANQRIQDELIPYFPLGVFKDKTKADTN